MNVELLQEYRSTEVQKQKENGAENIFLTHHFCAPVLPLTLARLNHVLNGTNSSFISCGGSGNWILQFARIRAGSMRLLYLPHCSMTKCVVFIRSTLIIFHTFIRATLKMHSWYTSDVHSANIFPSVAGISSFLSGA